MIIETWDITHQNGQYETATLTTYGDGDYFVDMGCMLWNRHYKRYSAAKRYLEKCGYALRHTVIKLGGAE